MAANDEIWRPEYDGPPPVSGATTFDRTEPPAASGSIVPDRPWWRIVAVVAAVVALSFAAVVVIGSTRSGSDARGAIDVLPAITVIDDDRLQFSSLDGAGITDGQPLRLLDNPRTPFAGADPSRLPAEVAPRWTVELAPLVADGGDNAMAWVEAIGSRYVVAGIGDLRTLTGPSAIHVLDATSGDRLWVKQLESRIDQVEFVTVIDDVLVVTIAGDVLALDTRSGSELWSARLAKVDGPVERIEELAGTGLLVVTSPEPDDPIRLVAPRSGAAVGEMVGDVIGTDHQGRWYVLKGDDLLEFDLARVSEESANGDAMSPTIDAEPIGAIDADRSRATAVIDGSIIATLGEILAVGPLEADGERLVGSDGLTPLTIDLGTPEWLVLVRAIVPLGGAAFATVGGGTVSGAELINGAIRFGWQRRGTVTASYGTERGVLLLVGTEGGAAQTLVDGATGETIALLTMSPGLFDALDVVGNGVVTRRTSRDGPRIAGLDLDGNELWALDGSTPVSVGDGVVVRAMPQSDGSFEVTAFGDVE